MAGKKQKKRKKRAKELKLQREERPKQRDDAALREEKPTAATQPTPTKRP
jgi:hypothetical protein